MKRIAILFGSCLLCVAACGPGTGPAPDERSVEDDYIGGWDAEGSDGAAILLLREGLIGTLNITSLQGREQRFRLIFDVQGETEDEALMISLNCSEARAQDLTADEPEDTEPDAGSETTGEGDPASRDGDADPADDGWAALDCSGWDLELSCSLAGECNSGDCNMVCDVVFFGDAYAVSEIELGRVEDAFDYWQRV
jgi:hypothetical protein